MSEDLIEKYADLVERLDMLNSNMAELLQKAVTPEVKKAQEEITAEYQPMIEQVQTALAETREKIEALILETSETWKGTRYMAVWNKGRETWEGKLLDGFAMSHPEILQAKKFGKPTVTFRQVK